MSNCNTCGESGGSCGCNRIPVITSCAGNSDGIGNCDATVVVHPPTRPEPTYVEYDLGVKICKPECSPTLEQIQEEGFHDQLVTIKADYELCKEDETVNNCEHCDEPAEDCDCDCEKEDLHDCVAPVTNESFATAGSPVPTHFLDVRPSKSMQLFGRCGKFLAKLTGQGYLYLDGETGKVSVQETVKLNVTQLWHKFTTVGGQVVVGPPMGVDYLCVVGPDGCPYAIRGVDGDEPTVMMYDPVEKLWSPQTLDTIPFQISGQLAPADSIELIGVEPIPTDATDCKQVRAPRRLNGTGLVVLQESTTVTCDDDCECSDPTIVPTSVASVLELPAKDDCSGSMYQVLVCGPNGLEFVDPADIPELKGEDGEDGEDGETPECIPGPVGPEGPVGRTVYSQGCECPETSE